ncbi:MAG: hypothetical protein HKP24_02270 [Croceitalea sp.]|nr:hypothetical protein [Croceitalea sp.]
MIKYVITFFFALGIIGLQPTTTHETRPQATYNFIIHSITADLPAGTAEFRATYGVGFVIENCVVDPFSFQRATDNNQMIALYLDERFGDIWWADLPVKPFGL